MGHRFFEHTMPRLVEELGHMRKALEAIVELARAGDALLHAPPPGAVPRTPWKATLLQIATRHLRIDSFEPQGSDRLDFRQVHIIAVDAALQAAYRAGIAAGVQHIRLDDRESDGSPGRDS